MSKLKQARDWLRRAPAILVGIGFVVGLVRNEVAEALPGNPVAETVTWVLGGICLVAAASARVASAIIGYLENPADPSAGG